jgi:hypothetical protein
MPDLKYAPDGIRLPFADDVQRQNWYWLMEGESGNMAYELALAEKFNDNMRSLMTRDPVMTCLIAVMPEHVSDGLKARALEAQERLYPPKVASVVGNVITANFGRRKHVG